MSNLGSLCSVSLESGGFQREEESKNLGHIWCRNTSFSKCLSTLGALIGKENKRIREAERRVSRGRRESKSLQTRWERCGKVKNNKVTREEGG